MTHVALTVPLLFMAFGSIAPPMKIPVEELYKYTSNYLNIRLSDGDILQNLRMCSYDYQNTYYAIAPLVPSEEDFNGTIPAFVYTQYVLEPCIIQSEAQWDSTIREGSVAPVPSNIDEIERFYANFSLSQKAGSTFLEWKFIDSQISKAKSDATISMVVIFGATFISFFSVLAHFINWKLFWARLYPQGSHVRYDEIDEENSA